MLVHMAISNEIFLQTISVDRRNRKMNLFWNIRQYFRVVAIDQRGYGLSSKPSNVSDYKIELLARDIADIVDQLGYKSCVLVGHDWGAIVAWGVSILYETIDDFLSIEIFLFFYLY